MTFPEIETQRLRQLYSASRWIQGIWGLTILAVVVDVGALVFLANGGDGYGSGEARAIAMGLLGLGLAVHLGFLIGWARRAKWARPNGIVLCVLALFVPPFGTVIGIFGLVAFARSAELFGSERRETWEVAAEYRARKKAWRERRGGFEVAR